MKNIKNLLGLLAIALLVFTCSSDDEEAITASQTAGSVINNNDTSGKILGIPAAGVDLTEALIDFTDVELDFDLKLEFGTLNDVIKYEIVKTYTKYEIIDEEEVVTVSDEVSITETPTLPFNFTYSSIDDYIAGLSVQADELRIGDQFTFMVKLYKSSGDILYYDGGLGSYTVTVNCASFLAGMYQVTTVRDDGGTWDQGIEEIVEVSPGYYKTVTTGGWGAGTIAPDQGYNFNDTCNVLTLPNQTLAQGFYSNDVTGEADGVVAANGDLVLYYKIGFGSGDRTYTSTYVKQ